MMEGDGLEELIRAGIGTGERQSSSRAEGLHCLAGRGCIVSTKEKTSDGPGHTSVTLSSSTGVGGPESETLVALVTLLGKPGKGLFKW